MYQRKIFTTYSRHTTEHTRAGSFPFQCCHIVERKLFQTLLRRPRIIDALRGGKMSNNVGTC